MNDRPILSIVTGTLNRPNEFVRLVESIKKRTTVSWELVVSDASSEPYRYLSILPKNIRILPERPRQGCVRGYNRAFWEARGKWVIFLNDDCEVLPAYADIAIDFMSLNQQIGLGALYYCEGKPPFIVNTYWGMVYANFGIISRSLGDAIGWFDEELTMYGNDNSLAFRVLLAGKGIATIPGAHLWHHVILDSDKIANQQYRNPDADTLRRKYEPHLNQMLAVYSKTAHLASPMVIGG